MTDELLPVPLAARTPMTKLLALLLRAQQQGWLVVDDALTGAVHSHATTVRSTEAEKVIPAMISVAEALAKVRKALDAAEHAARQEIDAALDDLGADTDTGKIDGKAVYVTGADGERYRIGRGHVVKTGYRDEPVTRMLAAALRMDYRPPNGTPEHLSGVFGDEFEAGVSAGIAAARAGIGSGGGWKTGELTRFAHRLARAGDTGSAGLLAAARYQKTSRRDVADFTAVKSHRPTRMG